VEVGQPQTLFGKRIQGWCSNLATKGADVRVPQIIGDDEENVWPRSSYLIFSSFLWLLATLCPDSQCGD
jgi:hypothetical protein